MGIFDRLKRKTGTMQALSDVDDAAQIDSELPRTAFDERFIDQGQIAKGGMGSIRCVFNRNLLRKEAMKVLSAKHAEDENEVLRFLEEAQITGQLEHPNIPPVHEVGETAEGHQFFTMKLVSGQTLEALLSSPKYDVGNDELLFDVLQVFIKVCDAIAFAHSRGVIHCDLKPPNIMIGKYGQAYVMDWGIARVKGSARKRKTETGADLVQTLGRDKAVDDGRVMGTLGYMAPEQAEGELGEIDERTDVFALGALLYRILTTRAPHVGATPDETWELAKACQIVEPQAAAEAKGIKARLPVKLCRAAMKALEPSKDDRYQTASELQKEVEEFVRGAGRYPTESYEPGQLVIKEGDFGDTAYVILKGKARAFRTEHGQTKTLRQMGPSDVFGETAILTDKPRSASVEAIEPLTVVVVNRDALEREMGQTFWVGHILRALAERFRDVDRRLEAEEHSPERKLREEVLRHFAFHGVSNDDGSRQVPWMPLRRALRKKLALGDMQVMALCAGVRGLRVDEKTDTAHLVPDEAPASATPPPPPPQDPTPAPTPAPTPVVEAAAEPAPAEAAAPYADPSFGATEMLPPEGIPGLTDDEKS